MPVLPPAPPPVEPGTSVGAVASGADVGGTTVPSDDTEPFGSGPGIRGLHCSTRSTREPASADSRLDPSTAGAQSGSTLTRTGGPTAYVSTSANRRPSLAWSGPWQVWPVGFVGRARSAAVASADGRERVPNISSSRTAGPGPERKSPFFDVEHALASVSALTHTTASP